MTCTEAYKEHIEYTFHAFYKIVIRNASYTAIRTWSRKHEREISLDYLTDEKYYPFGTTDEYFKAPEHYGEWTAQKDDRPHIRPESIDSGHLLPREKAFLRNLYPLLLGVGHPPPARKVCHRPQRGRQGGIGSPAQTEIPTPGGKFFRRGSNIR